MDEYAEFEDGEEDQNELLGFNSNANDNENDPSLSGMGGLDADGNPTNEEESEEVKA